MLSSIAKPTNLLQIPSRASAVQFAFVGGCALLTTCTAAALLLTLDQLGAWELPGCGGESACAAVSASRWATLPIVGWPLSYLGLAYFEAMLVAWCCSAGQLTGLLRGVAWLGGLGSLVLIAVLLREGHMCVYCLTIHTANLMWIALAERHRLRNALSSANGQSPSTALAAYAATFVLTALLLGMLQSAAEAAGTAELISSLQTSIEDGCRVTGSDLQSGTNSALFAPGRYVLGPADAAHHLVAVSDYECPSCQKIHYSLKLLLASRRDLSLSVRHFPLCSECNDHVNASPHANACQAARASEAAGLLGGHEAFWRMHDWLFEHQGKFSKAELESAVLELGLPLPEFHATMKSNQVTDILQADAQDAHDTGLQYTPMIFLDGRALDIAQVKAEP